MSNIINLTPHAIRVCDANANVIREYPASGLQARVTTPAAPAVEAVDGVPCEAYASLSTGKLECLRGKGETAEVLPFPQPVEGTFYIVSLPCADLLTLAGRTDCVLPGTGPRDNAVRTKDGREPSETNPITEKEGLVFGVRIFKRVV